MDAVGAHLQHRVDAKLDQRLGNLLLQILVLNLCHLCSECLTTPAARTTTGSEVADRASQRQQQQQQPQQQPQQPPSPFPFPFP